MEKAAQQVILGKVAATHGIKGELRVVTYSGDADTLLSLTSVQLKKPTGGIDVFPVRKVVCRGKKIIVALEGFDDINQVLPLVGRELCATRAQFPELPPGEYYWFDLEGLSVRTTEGVLLGTLVDIMATGSNDVYVVKGEGKEFLIPAVEDIVLQIDLDEGVVIVDPPEGLLDL